MTTRIRMFAGIICFALLSRASFAQPKDAVNDKSGSPASSSLPAFDLADVHASPHSNTPFFRGGDLRGGQYIVRQGSMVDLIANAYGVPNDNVLSGPAWLDTYRFDIVAKAPRTTSPEDVKLMLRNLLADRFHLVVHNDTKPIPSYVLRVDTARGGPKLREAADTSASPNCEQHHTPTLPDGTLGHFSVNCHNETMDAFRPFLADLGNLYMPNKPLVNATDLKGAYDFDLEFTYKPAPGGLTIFDAVDKQLGLKLALEDYPTPVIVVDSVNDKPSPNPPGVKELPPPPPAVFDVSVITPSKPDTRLGLQIKGGQVNVTGVTMKFLITWAWGLNPNNSEAVVGAPKWMSEDHYDILGKATPPDPQASGRNAAPQIDFDALQEMMRSLVMDRLKLQSHMEDRPADAYALVAVSPKMKKGDPMMRTGCKEGPGPDGKDPRIANPILGRLLTCQNMTMAEFGEQLRSLAGGYIFYPVEDHTGLEGGYDFTLSFSTAGQLQSGPPRTASSDSSNPSSSGSSSSNASEPNGGISLFDAINKQLGLKLEKQKRPEPMLVIDHIEKPTDN